MISALSSSISARTILRRSLYLHVFTSSVIIKLFISFSGLIAMAKNFNTILNRSGESGHLCLLFKASLVCHPFTEAFPDPLL